MDEFEKNKSIPKIWLEFFSPLCHLKPTSSQLYIAIECSYRKSWLARSFSHKQNEWNIINISQSICVQKFFFMNIFTLKNKLFRLLEFSYIYIFRRLLNWFSTFKFACCGMNFENFSNLVHHNALKSARKVLRGKSK